MGDLATIKSITLGMWGPNNDSIPLQIAVRDTANYTPFSIAVLRGHMDVAKAILEIARAQYQPQEPTSRERFRMRTEDDYDEYDSDGNRITDGDNDDDKIRLYSEIVDDQFTVGNIGEISSQVKSTISPAVMMSWTCNVSTFLDHTDEGRKEAAKAPVEEMPSKLYDFAPIDGAGGARKHLMRNNAKLWEPLRPNNLIQYAIWTENTELLDFLLDLGDKYKDTNASHQILANDADLYFALSLGRIRSLTELIKRTGQGIPLDEFVKESGVDVAEKPRYYQGLSIHGQKRADWAAAGRATQIVEPVKKHPPLLEAAFDGSIESVEWLLSTAPMRYYAEFAKKHMNDPRLKRLEQADGGFDRSISNWLGLRSESCRHKISHECMLTLPCRRPCHPLRRYGKAQP